MICLCVLINSTGDLTENQWTQRSGYDDHICFSFFFFFQLPSGFLTLSSLSMIWEKSKQGD